MEEQLMNAIVSALGTVLVGLIGYLAQKLAAYLDKKGVTEQLASRQYLVDIAVSAVEQIYTNEHGEQKFNRAKDEALKLLSENGIKVSSQELNAMIEASVKAMNDAFNKNEDSTLPIK